MAQTNIYAPPKSNLELKVTDEKCIINQLKWSSTWHLFLLTVVTLGIYNLHYMKRQTAIINTNIKDENKVSNWFISFTIVFAYASLLFLIPSYLYEEDHTLNKVAYLLEKLLNICIIVWIFKARNRLNQLLKTPEMKEYWFHGLWIFLFQSLYFNYKINAIHQEKA